MSGCYCNPYVGSGSGTQPTTKIESYVKVVSSGLTDAERKKLAGIEENANNYVLPVASKEVLGGFKVGTGLKMSSDGTLSVTSIADEVEDFTIIDGGGAAGNPDDDNDDGIIWDGGGSAY